jgi:hypothetical protein
MLTTTSLLLMAAIQAPSAHLLAPSLPATDTPTSERLRLLDEKIAEVPTSLAPGAIVGMSVGFGGAVVTGVLTTVLSSALLGSGGAGNAPGLAAYLLLSGGLVVGAVMLTVGVIALVVGLLEQGNRAHQREGLLQERDALQQELRASLKTYPLLTVARF